MGFSGDAGFAASKIDSCYVVAGGGELSEGAATTALGIVGMTANT
jgi:hypothetical protein